METNIFENDAEKSSPIRRVYNGGNINKIPVLFMMVGIVGSGKTSFAESLCIEKGQEGKIVKTKPIIHSSDSLRKELYGDENVQSDNNKLFNELHRRIKADLLNGNDVVYDATNINKRRRADFLRQLNDIECKKVCVCVLTPYDLCLEQNRNRGRVVPEEVIKRMYLNFQPPALHEGFDNIILHYNYNGSDKLKKRYTIKNFLFGDVCAISINQENSHHTLTIGNHCVETARYIHYYMKRQMPFRPYSEALYIAALIHDNGKPFTKSRLNAKGEVDTECHYYQHHCCGAYDSFFYTDNIPTLKTSDKIYIANLIYFHMKPFTSWKQSEKAAKRDREMIGEDMYADIMKLHEADKAAK